MLTSRNLLALCLVSLFLTLSACDSTPPVQMSTLTTTVTLNTGKDIAPSDAVPLRGANLPMTLAATPDGQFTIICGMGYREALWAVRTADAQVVSQTDFAAHVERQRAGPQTEEQPTKVDSRHNADRPQTNGLYYGIVATNNTVYAAQGGHDAIAVLSLSPTGQLMLTDTIRAQRNDFPAGLALDQHGLLYVSNNSSGGNPDPYRTPASMAIYDPATKTELGRYVFESTGNTSNYPLAITVLRNGSKTFVASERDGTVYSLNTTDPTHPTLNKIIPTGSHPDALLLNKDESRLFVANSQSDTVSVIDTASDKLIATILLRPDAVRGLPGVTPTSMALSPDERTLYVTLSDMNAVAVVDTDSQRILGMIPAGDYPSAVLAGSDRLLVVNAKGHKAHNPNPTYNPFTRKIDRDSYILSVILGDVQSMPISSAAKLPEQTQLVMTANHFNRLTPPTPATAPAIGAAFGKIKHVIYIIKENRTYDQVLGDDARGNGDASLALFNEKVTPNQHALADRFVLLDNIYACGEVSGDGWVWSTQGIANAYVERTISYNYSGRGRTFDYEGENNGYPTGGFPATDPDGKPLSNDPQYRNGAPPVPDVAGADVHLWDLARRAHLSIRNYGFYLSEGDKKAGVTMIPENYPTVAGLQPPGHDLAGITDMDFRRFDLDYPDSDAPQIWFDRSNDPNCLYQKKSYGKHAAPSRFAEWNSEFQQMLQQDPTGDSVPALMTIRLPHDHTQGLTSKKHTPMSEVADNDYAVGQLVEAISHSPIWSSTAIFIIEDDAQAGPDHVDCHRTTAYVISPWIKPGSVDHEFHNTDSMLRTIEQLLGLQPMSQYDATATLISDWDKTAANADPYAAILPPQQIISAINITAAKSTTDAAIEKQLELASDQMDFVHADAAPAAQLNLIIWKSVKGMNSTMPLPRNSLVSPTTPPKTDDDDDDD
jgi:YVTN family beta-propeller protein